MFQTQNITLIDKMLKNHPLALINILGRIRVNQEPWVFHLKSLENPKSFIFEQDNWFAPYGETQEDFKEIMASFSFPKEADFCGIPLLWANWVMESLPDYELNWEESCALYYMPIESYENFLQKPLRDSLKIKDLEKVNDHYTYKEEGSDLYLKKCIEKNPSSVIREGNEPVSWALMREDGSLGVMYTLESHRKKGYAVEVSYDLIHKVIQEELQPYLHIRVENEASRKLAEKLGFKYWGDVLWFGLKLKAQQS